MAVTIDISVGISGTWTIEDDGTPGNGISVVRDPNGVIFGLPFAHPADSVTIVSRAGQNINVNITDSLTTANFTIGSLTVATERPDNINMGALLTSGTVTLTANGAINEFGSDSATDIIAGTLLLDAGTGVGTGGNALETQIGVLEAESVTGGINLSNINNLVIGGVTAELRGLFTLTSGNITLVNQGNVILADETGLESVHGAANVNINAIGATAYIFSGVDQDSFLVSGNLTLTAEQDVLFGTAGADFDNDVRAGGSIVINAGRDFTIDGFSDLAADDMGGATGGGVTINAGRNLNVDDVNGTDASVGVSGSGGGSVHLTTGVGGTLNLGASSTAAVFAGSGGVFIETDRALIEADSGISSTSGGTVQLTTRSAGRQINLGSASDGAIALELSDAELDRISAANLILGGAAAGQVTVVGALSSTVANVTLESGSDILLQASLAAATSVTLRSAENVTVASGGITTGALSVFVDTPDADAPGGIFQASVALAVTSSAINGNADADTLAGTSGNDIINAGGGTDFIWAQQGGTDAAIGGGDNDKAYFGAAWTSADSYDGGAGTTDVLILQGNYSLTGVDGFGNISGVEKIRLLTGSDASFGDIAGNIYSYTVTTANDDVAAGQRLIVEGISMGASEILTFDGSAESDGFFQVFGGAANDSIVGGQGDDHLLGMGGNDFLVGGQGNDRLRGDVGQDAIQGGAGADILVYVGPGDSTSSTFDTIIGFDQSEDKIDLASAVTGWTGNITTGFLGTPTFDANIAAAVNAALQPNSAVLFTPDSGTFVGRAFAVIDGNGDGNYTAGADYVMEFSAPVTPIDTTAAYFV